MAGVSWDYYDKQWIKDVEAKYLPPRGEGETMATQITTAIAKLVYKWYNDGDVFDNQHGLEGWCNDLSSYANWLALYVDGADEILGRIFDITTGAQYEELLKDLVDKYQDMDLLDQYNAKPKVGTVYDCEGPFVFREYYDDDEEEEEDY